MSLDSWNIIKLIARISQLELGGEKLKWIKKLLLYLECTDQGLVP